MHDICTILFRTAVQLIPCRFNCSILHTFSVTTLLVVDQVSATKMCRNKYDYLQLRYLKYYNIANGKKSVQTPVQCKMVFEIESLMVTQEEEFMLK